MALSDQTVIAYRASSRRDPRFWLLLAFGLVFIWGGFTIDPQSNCSEDGRECAPWLVPVAAGMGLLTTAMALGQLLANTARGSTADLARGRLEWWQNRTARHPGDSGSIDASDIALIRIVKESDKADAVHLYNRAGERQPYFDEDVIPWRAEEWAARLIAAWPHIRLEVCE